MAKVLVGAITVLLASLGLGMTSATAGTTSEADSPRKQEGTYEVTVEAQRIVDAQRNPKAPEDTCNTIVFYEFPDVPGTISATVTYAFKGGELRKASGEPPFDDVTDTSPPRFAPVGRHRIGVSYGSVAGSGAGGGCEESQVPGYEALYAPTGSVLLTVEGEAEPPIDQKKCKAARADLKARNKAVGKLLGKLRKAPNGDAKDRIREQLAKAKDKRASAVQKVSKACT